MLGINPRLHKNWFCPQVTIKWPWMAKLYISKTIPPKKSLLKMGSPTTMSFNIKSWSNDFGWLGGTPFFKTSKWIIEIWGFPKIGVPLNHPCLKDVPFILKPSSYWGTTISGNLHLHPWIPGSTAPQGPSSSVGYSPPRCRCRWIVARRFWRPLGVTWGTTAHVK